MFYLLPHIIVCGHHNLPPPFVLLVHKKDLSKASKEENVVPFDLLLRDVNNGTFSSPSIIDYIWSLEKSCMSSPQLLYSKNPLFFNQTPIKVQVKT